MPTVCFILSAQMRIPPCLMPLKPKALLFMSTACQHTAHAPPTAASPLDQYLGTHLALQASHSSLSLTLLSRVVLLLQAAAGQLPPSMVHAAAGSGVLLGQRSIPKPWQMLSPGAFWQPQVTPHLASPKQVAD